MLKQSTTTAIAVIDCYGAFLIMITLHLEIYDGNVQAISFNNRIELVEYILEIKERIKNRVWFYKNIIRTTKPYFILIGEARTKRAMEKNI